MENETILCLSTRQWHSLWRNTQQIMWRLAQTNHVIFVEPQRDPDASYGASLRRNSRYFGRLALENITPSLTVVRTPPGLPYARQNLPGRLLRLSVPLVASVNNALLAWHLRRVLRALRVEQPILWLYEPRMGGLVGRLGEKLACYFNYDELADFAPNARIRDLLQAYDDRLCRQVDVVFASSTGQSQRRQRLNPNTHFVPNAVDYPHFSQALDPATPTAPELASLGRPILGFVGWLGHQLDVPLLDRVAAAYPNCALVLVGPDALEKTAAYQALRARPNVLFVGRQPLETLPSYLKAFNVALLPYNVKSGHTHAIYPLKLHEYLAAGCSVLAADMPELKPFAPVIRIARDDDEFVQLVPQALADNAPERKQARTNVARQHTWEQRVGTIHRVLDQALAQRQAGARPASTAASARQPINGGLS
jgi:glycosyltransferase involved in cell wall biosynthesis